MKNDQSNTSTATHDVATFFIGLGLAICGLGILSWMGIIAALAVRLPAWFFGNLTRTGIVALALGALAIVWGGLSGDIIVYLTGFFGLFSGSTDTSVQSHPIWIRWLTFSLQPTTWLVSGAIGSIIGGSWLLFQQDELNSPTSQVFGKSKQRKPPPYARIRGYLITRAAQSYTGLHILLGVDAMTGMAVRISQDQLSRHVVVTGRSGRGKTVTVLRLASECARLGIPIVYLDGKGDLEVRKELAKIAEMNQRRFYPLDAGHPSRSCAYDAFSGKRPTEQKELVIQLREWSEAHFRGLASAHAQTTFKSLQYGRIVQDLHTFSRNLAVKNMLGLAKRGAGRRQDYDQIKAEIIRRRTNEKQVMDSLEAVVETITASDFGDLLNIAKARLQQRPILNLGQLREESGIAYVGLPALQYPDAASVLASLVVGDLKSTLVRSRKRILLIMDEFSFFSNPTTTLNLINMGRSYGACVCLATQSWADFSASGSDDFRRQVIGSVNNFWTHELTGSEDAEVVAGLYSTTELVEYTAQVVDGQRTDSASSRSVHQFRLHPAFIKRLGTGEAYVLNKDQPDRVCHAKILQPSTS
ncbi:helicase HerA-like domain-containing protein [Tardiphaga alba]|uniref:helicase HerA-like domain-containing protein n=1 Tax=Tardiphaga alba TaxID=340268 RepID=UPI001BAB4A28|nr:helicase HerA-like domain-containing protein [Tardiphaga alba]